MKACKLVGSAKTELVEIPIPEINDEEVLIRVRVCGICASELSAWLGDYSIGKILGHEVVGEIEAVGKNVEGFGMGDRVTGLIYEGFAEYTKANYRDLVLVPDTLDDAEALGEPLACLVSGAERTEVKLGDTVAVIGAGYMGLGFLQLMKLKGAGKLLAIDVREEGQKNALKFGADLAMAPGEVDGKYLVTDWDQMDRGIDVAIEASGSQGGLDLAGNMTGVHGILSVVGFHQNGPRMVNMELWNWKGITVINAHERRNDVYIDCMKAGLFLIAQGRLNMKDMITHKFPLAQLDQAFTALKEKPEGFIKGIITLD